MTVISNNTALVAPLRASIATFPHPTRHAGNNSRSSRGYHARSASWFTRFLADGDIDFIHSVVVIKVFAKHYARRISKKVQHSDKTAQDDILFDELRLVPMDDHPILH